jgi:hypothetical protein
MSWVLRRKRALACPPNAIQQLHRSGLDSMSHRNHKAEVVWERTVHATSGGP